MLKVTKIASCGGVDFLHTQITQNKIFAKSLWYLKKKWGMMLNFCADEYQNFLSTDAINFDGHDQACLKYSN